MAIASAGVAVVGGVAQSIISAKKAKKASDAIKNYKRQELTNAYEDMTVSTRAAELQREELARATSSSVQALRAGGLRGVIGGVGSVQQQNVLSSRSIGADLDRQQQNIDQLRAGDEARIRDIQEQREIGDLEGLGTELNTQRQNTTNGINTAISGAGSLMGAMGAMGGPATTARQTQIPVQTQMAGVTNALPQGSLIPPSLGMRASGLVPTGYGRPTAPLYPGN